MGVDVLPIKSERFYIATKRDLFKSLDNAIYQLNQTVIEVE